MSTRYTPRQAIESRRLLNESGRRLYVLFPYWHAGQGTTYSSLVRRLARDGPAVVAYGLNDHILQPNIDVVLESFEWIQKQIVADIQKLIQANQYTEVRLGGLSLGNVSLAKVAQRFHDFAVATIVVGGSNLARCTWEGIRTQAIRKAFEEQGISEELLDVVWQSLAPKQAAEAFRDKQVYMVVSSSDRIIPTFYQREMTTTLNEVTDDLQIVYYRAGHAASILRFCTRGWV
jgi:esterase/lipase